VQASCPAGKRLVGGGAQERIGFLAPGVPVALTDSGPLHPVIGNVSNMTCFASAEEYAATNNNWNIRAYAIYAEG
jgi:hypothetical protein